MSRKPSIRSNLVHEVGAGKAAFDLHGPNWLAVGCDINLTDARPEALTPYKPGVRESMRAAYEMGRLSFRSLGELEQTPGIVDITTPAEHHVGAIEQTLEQLRARGVNGRELTWLIEKPMTSSRREREALVSLFDSNQLELTNTFVNELYLASKSLKAAEVIIAMEKAKAEEKGEDVHVKNVDVVFNKNRIPDVLAGRFTDPKLQAYGIEMPHQLVIGYRLAGVTPQEANPQILENQHYNAVAGVPHSQGNYTVLRVANGATIRMAQGLGPYTMQANGDIIPRADQPVERYVEVTLSNGSWIRLELAPIAGMERFTTRTTWRDAEGQIHENSMDDHILKTVMGGIATYAATGVRPFFAEDFNVPNGLIYAKTLDDLAADGIR